MTPERIKELRERGRRQQHPAGPVHSECDRILGECLDSIECLQQELFTTEAALSGFREINVMWEAAAKAFEAKVATLEKHDTCDENCIHSSPCIVKMRSCQGAEGHMEEDDD